MSSPCRLPIPGEIIEQKHKNSCIGETCRVLAVSEGLNRIVLIPVEPRRSRNRLYFVGPRIMDLGVVLKNLEQNYVATLKGGIAPRADAIATDEDLDKKYLRKGQKISKPREERQRRNELIAPLISDMESRALLFDPQIRSEKIAERAQSLLQNGPSIERIKKMLSEFLFQYWAGGSVPGALTPFSGRKGGRGKSRIQKKKLGRRNAPTAAGQSGQEGFVMGEKDKDICGFGWRNYYIRGVTIKKALRRMWREFYSTLRADDDGKVKKILLPVNERPTLSQFERWGKDRSPGHEGWKKQLTKFNLGRIDRVLFGTAKDGVVAIGQRGAIDSTAPDMEFVSVIDRLDRIGPANRILVVDSMYGYISGFYLGLEASNADTVKLAFLHSLTDKTEWLKWLGLENQDPGNWIPIRFSEVLADNTEARCESVKEELDQIGTGFKFVGVARSDLNSSAETGHHTLHRMVDHNLHGTTHGQRHERGEERADILARHTIIEAIRETARAIYTHNTIELDVQPTLEMRRELLDKGVKLTRANLTRWKINQGKVAMSLISTEEARIKLLPRVRGTFTQHGIRLLRPDTGLKRVFIESVRYVSRHPVIIERVMKSKVGRGGVSAEFFDDEFLHDPYNPNEIYYRNPMDGELIELQAKTQDEDLLFECSYYDMVDIQNRDATYRFNARNSAEESFSEMEAGQDQTKREACDSYDEALDEREMPLSKAALKRGKSENRSREKSLYSYGMPIQPSNEIEREVPSTIIEGDLQQAASLSALNLDVSRDDVSSQDGGVSDTGGMPTANTGSSAGSLLTQSIRRRSQLETRNGR